MNMIKLQVTSFTWHMFEMIFLLICTEDSLTLIHNPNSNKIKEQQNITK